MTKKSKHFLRSLVTKPSFVRASMMNTLEVIEHLRRDVIKAGKWKQKVKVDLEEEFIEINKLIWITLEHGENKSAMFFKK